MSALTCKARFMSNNFVDGDGILVSATSAHTSYPITNLADQRRSKVWRPAGNFEITAANNKFYFNDGVARTATVPIGIYSPATLASALTTACTATGTTAGPVVLSAVTTEPYLWKVTFTASVTLTLATTTNAIWNTIGFTGTTNRVGTSFIADAARAHTHEQITWYFGAPMLSSFVGVVGPISEALKLSHTATATLLLNNVNSWAAPPVVIPLTRTDAGLFNFYDSSVSSGYEYAALRIVDPANVLGSRGLELGHVYVGDHDTMTNANVEIGFSKSYVDSSTVQVAEFGQRYANSRPKYRAWRGLVTGKILATERRALEQWLFNVGVTRNFYASLDPQLEVSLSLEEMTFYGYIPADAIATNAIRDYYSLGFDILEAV